MPRGLSLREAKAIVESGPKLKRKSPAGIDTAIKRAKLEDTPLSSGPKVVKVGNDETGNPPVRSQPRAMDRDKLGLGHSLFISGTVIWCNSCGVWGTVRISSNGLGGDCKAAPRSGQKGAVRRTVLKRLQGNMHPLNKTPLANARTFQ